MIHQMRRIMVIQLAGKVQHGFHIAVIVFAQIRRFKQLNNRLIGIQRNLLISVPEVIIIAAAGDRGQAAAQEEGRILAADLMQALGQHLLPDRIRVEQRIGCDDQTVHPIGVKSCEMHGDAGTEFVTEQRCLLNMQMVQQAEQIIGEQGEFDRSRQTVRCWRRGRQDPSG